MAQHREAGALGYSACVGIKFIDHWHGVNAGVAHRLALCIITYVNVNDNVNNM